jgi:hypothetical protein
MPEATQVDIPAQLRMCPDCGYQNGFHVAFRRVEPSNGERTVAVQLICPSCSALLDIGLRVCLTSDR